MKKFGELILENDKDRFVFKKPIIGESVDKDLLMVIKKEFATYGGPSGKSPLEEYFKAKVTKELNDGLRQFFKTKDGDKVIQMFADDNGNSFDDEADYYKDDLEMFVSKLTIETRN